MEEQEFNVGTKVYYPVHGVAELTSLETRKISGTEFSIYVLTVVESGLKIMVPTS
ncbi:MAG: CarD family transcriptional regulator, partial [Kofleriaceae bacterium]|nr:CarD family transcriptional regulator [Kofleriaceae bacterium]